MINKKKNLGQRSGKMSQIRDLPEGRLHKKMKRIKPSQTKKKKQTEKK